MDINIDYVKRKFDEYNELCFGGELQPLPFKLSNARSFLGMVRFKRERMPDKTWHYFDFEFIVSQKMCESTGDEQEVEDTIIHEMIHYWILSNQMQDNAPHGDIFKSKMRDINARFNRHIAISYKRSREEVENDTEIRMHIVCAARLRTNQYGIAVVPRTRLFELWDKMRLIPGVEEVKWYMSLDPFFNRFPRALKPKLYLATQEEIKEHLEFAGELEKVGHVIQVK